MQFSLLVALWKLTIPSDVKAATVATVIERELFALFITANLNASSPGARQTIASTAGKMLLRTRRLPLELESGPLWVVRPALWLALLAESSLGPSSSYQARRLELYVA